MKRRKFLTTGAGVTAGALAAPAIGHAQESFNWRMTNAYPPQLPFYTTGPGSPDAFVEKVEKMSNGRLRIDHFAAGELIPALEGFDAVASGTIEMNAANSYFWAGKVPAAQIFSAVPFGLDFEGMTAWLYSGDGLDLWHEIYAPHGVIAFPLNDSGVQMTGWFREPIESVDQFSGLKMRIPGLAGEVYSRLGVNVQLLPGGEIFPALERGVIDAAEFVGPFLDRRLGLHNAAKYYYTTGWHEPSTTGELLINLNVWESLPEDLQEIVRVAAKATHLEAIAHNNAVNGEALRDLVENEGVTAQPLPDEVVERLREVSQAVLEDRAAQDEDFGRVLESYHAFRDTYWSWAEVSQRPYHSSVVRT